MSEINFRQWRLLRFVKRHEPLDIIVANRDRPSAEYLLEIDFIRIEDRIYWSSVHKINVVHHVAVITEKGLAHLSSIFRKVIITAITSAGAIVGIIEFFIKTH